MRSIKMLIILLLVISLAELNLFVVKLGTTQALAKGVSAQMQEPTETVLPDDVKKALLSEDWQRVADLLDNVVPNTPSPVLRLIKGHACLALNRNNESLALFASTLNDRSREQWQTWANDFVSRHGNIAIAWYFQGDAFARRKALDSASKTFDRAIELDAKCYLALNARGVVAHSVGNTLMARTYFVKATKAKEDFSDGFASRGTLNVYLNSVKGEDEYQQAKQLSKDENPILPLIGLGCMHYGKQEYDTAVEHFKKVPETSDLAMLVRRNELLTELEKLRSNPENTEEVGTLLERLERLGITPLGSPRGEDKRKSNRSESGFTPLRPPQEVLPGLRPGIITLGRKGDRGPIRPRPEGNPPRHPKPDDKPGKQPKGPKTGKGDRGLIRPRPEGNPPPHPKPDDKPRKQPKGPKKKIPNVGGADSDPSKVRLNQGQWGVCNVYGLLYAVEDTSAQKPVEKL